MLQVETARRETWDNWLRMREASADTTRQEIENEMQLLHLRDQAQTDELGQYIAMTQETEARERDILHRALGRSQEIEDEKQTLRQTLEAARRKQAESFLNRQKQMEEQAV
jgi:hypothetical protein